MQPDLTHLSGEEPSPVPFSLTSQKVIEITAALLVFPNMLVDGLVADLNTQRQFESPRDLLRAIVLAQQAFDHALHGQIQLDLLSGSSPSSICPLDCQTTSVALDITVTAYLSVYGASGSTQ